MASELEVGKVGIGITPDAAAKLDVNGTIYVRNTSVKGVISCPSSDIFDIANASGGTSNPITFSTQGEERMRISSSGSVNVSGPFLNVGGGYGSTGLSISDAGALQADGLATFSGGIAQGGTSGDNTANIDASGIMNIRRPSGVGRNMINFHNGNDGSGNATFVGGITTNTTATQYNVSSDYRLKENLEPLTGALDRLDALPVYRFNFKADPDTTVDGFVAHEVSEHVPEAITGEKDAMKTVVVQEAVRAQPATYYEEGDELPEGKAVGDEKTPAVEAVEEVTEEQPDYQGIDQSKLVPLLVAAVKELKAKVEVLEGGE